MKFALSRGDFPIISGTFDLSSIIEAVKDIFGDIALFDIVRSITTIKITLGFSRGANPFLTINGGHTNWSFERLTIICSEKEFLFYTIPRVFFFNKFIREDIFSSCSGIVRVRYVNKFIFLLRGFSIYEPCIAKNDKIGATLSKGVIT